MKFLSQFVHLVIFLIASIEAINDDYDEYDHTNPLPEDKNKYSKLSARLNCSSFVVHHRGVKTVEVQTNSIYIEQEMGDSRNDTSSETGPDEDEDAVASEDESTETSTKLKDGSVDRTRLKRGLVRSERLWMLDNISIIDGYSKVTFYPPKAVKKSRMKRTVPVNDTLTTLNDTMLPAENGTVAECTAPFDDDGSEYNWYQIIVNNGGPPGKVNATLQSPKETEVLEPCYRPINNTSPPMEDLLYDYKLMEFEKVYRHERAFLRFAGMTSEFVDIVGELVWSPSDFPRRYYRVSYRKDDTGLYVNVRRRHKCSFGEDSRTVQCNRVNDFTPCEVEAET